MSVEDATLDNTFNFVFPKMIPCKVLECYDADTITLACTVFSALPHRLSARMSGIDAPEMRPSLADPNREAHKRAAKAARDWLRARCKGKMCQFRCDGTDKYGRTLGVLFVDNCDISAEMLSLMIVRPYDGGKRETWSPEALEVVFRASCLP